MPKAAGMQLLLRIRNSPGALARWGMRGLLTTTRYAEPALSIDELVDLSIDHDQRNKSETGRLGQLSENKTKISHYRNTCNVLTLLAFVTKPDAPTGVTGFN
jgi:hypothetical protein